MHGMIVGLGILAGRVDQEGVAGRPEVGIGIGAGADAVAARRQYSLIDAQLRRAVELWSRFV